MENTLFKIQVVLICVLDNNDVGLQVYPKRMLNCTYDLKKEHFIVMVIIKVEHFNFHYYCLHSSSHLKKNTCTRKLDVTYIYMDKTLGMVKRKSILKILCIISTLIYYQQISVLNVQLTTKHNRLKLLWKMQVSVIINGNCV